MIRKERLYRTGGDELPGLNMTDGGSATEWDDDGLPGLKKKEQSGIGSRIGGKVGTLEAPSEDVTDAYAKLTPKATSGIPASKIETPKTVVSKEEISTNPIGAAGKIFGNNIDIKRYDEANRASSTFVEQPLLAQITKKEVAPKQAEQKKQEENVEQDKKSKELKTTLTELYKDGADIDAMFLDYRNNTNSAVVHLMKRTGIKDPNLLYEDGFDEKIKRGLSDSNETDRVAYERLQKAKTARKTLLQNIQEGKGLEEMAVDYAAANNPEAAKNIEFLKNTPSIGEALYGRTDIDRKPDEAFENATLGRFMYEFLNDGAVAQEAAKIPGLTQQIQAARSELINKYPEFGKMYLGSLISQKMEDMGINNAILNIATKAERQKAVDALAKDGTINENEKRFIDENIMTLSGLGLLGRKITGNPIIDTPGALEGTVSSFYQGVKSIPKGLYELSGLKDEILGEQGALRKDLEMANRQVGVKPKGLIHEITQSGSQFLGQSLSIGGGGKILNTIKAVNNPRTAMGIVGGLQAYANYMPMARQMFPGNELKQRGFSTIMAGLEWGTENIFNDRKVVDGLLGKLKPGIKETIQDFTAKKISSEAARQQVTGLIRKALRDIPDASKYFVKGVGENTFEELVAQLGQQVTAGVFSGKPLEDWVSGDDLYNTARQAMLGSVFISGLSARADMQRNRGITAKNIYTMAQDVDYWKQKISEAAKLDETMAAEAPEKIQNLEYAAKVLEELDATDLTEKQKVKFLITELEKKIKGEQAEDVTVKAIHGNAIKGFEQTQQDLLDGKDDGSIEGDKSDELTPDETKAVKLAAKEGLPGVYGEIDPLDAIKDISHQAQGIQIAEDGTVTELEGGGRVEYLKRMGVSQDLIDAAIKAFPNPNIQTEQPTTTEGLKEGEEKVESKFPKPEVPIQDMSSEQLYEYGKIVREYNKNIEKEFFGEEGAKKYKEARRISNSIMSSREEVKAADKVMKEMEDSLTEAQRNEFFGIGFDKDGLYEHQEINDLASTVSLIEQAENVNDIARSLKLPLLSFSKYKKPSVETLTILNAAKRKASELGISTENLIKESIKNIAKDLKSKDDAAFLAKEILKQLVRESTPEAKQIEATTLKEGEQPTVSEPLEGKGISFDRKQQNDAYEGVSDIENNEPKKSIGEYISSLFGVKNSRKSAGSEYYNTDRKINGKDVVVRVSDHPHAENNKPRENDYTVSIVVNGEKPEGLTVNENYAELNIKANNKNIEDKIHELYDRFDDIEQRVSKLPKSEPLEGKGEVSTVKTKEEGGEATVKEGGVVEPTKEAGEGQTPPPQEPIEPVKEGEGKGGLNDKGILTHLAKAKNIPEASREGFEKEGLKYETKSQKEAQEVAKAVVEEMGIDDAVLAAEAMKFDGDVNSLVFAESLNKLKELEDAAKTPEEKLEAAKRFAEVGITYDKMARYGGRFNAAINYFYKKSPLGIVMMENEKRKEDFNEWAKGKDTSWKEYFEELKKQPEFSAVFKEEVKAELKKERVASRAKRIEKVRSVFAKAKAQFKNGATYSTIIPPHIIETALETMELAYEAGEAVAKIIGDAIDYISDKMGNANWDKDKFRKEWEEKLGEPKGRQPLSDEEIKSKLLDRFRKKLKGLTDKQKEEVVVAAHRKLIDAGALDYEDFKEIIARVLGRGQLTDAEAQKMKQFVADINAVDEAGKKARADRTAASRKAFREAEIKAGAASKDLSEMLNTRPNITQRLTSMMQLNTLGIPALINNPIYNVVNQLGVRLPVGIVKSMIDKGIFEVGKLFGKEYTPETDIFSLTVQREFFNKLGLGSREAVSQFLTGLNRMDYHQKEVYGQQIRPRKAVRDLYAYSKGDLKLTSAQVMDKMLQASPQGWTAEIIARTLNLGDKPQRFAAEGAQAAAFAKGLGLKGIDYDLFIDFPREEAYRVYKEKGLSDEEAGKKADYVKETITKEGERSTFQQDNFLNDILTRAFGGNKSGIGGLAKATLISPYIKIPSNAFWSYYNIVNPEMAMLQSLIYSAKAISKKNRGKTSFWYDKRTSSAAKDLNEAKYWFAHAAVGVATRAVIMSLVAAGIFRSGNDGDDTKKEREGELYYEPQGTVNITKLAAWIRGRDVSKVEGGITIPVKWLGHWGSVGNTIAKKYEGLTPEQKEHQNEFWNTMFGMMELEGLKDFEAGVLGNTSSLLSALHSQGGDGFKWWGINTINMFANIAHPAALAQISRAELPYYTTAKGDSFGKMLKNTMLQRSSVIRKLANEYPPSKVSIWGEPMKREGSVLMKLFGFNNTTKNNFAQPIYEDYLRTNDIGFFPPAVLKDKETTFEQQQKLETYIGRARKNNVEFFINDKAELEGYNMKYSDLNDEQKKLILQYEYQLGREQGYEDFYAEFPELKKEKEEKPLSEKIKEDLYHSLRQFRPKNKNNE